MNSSFVISEVFFCVEYFITSTKIVCMLGRCGLATYLHHNCCMGWPWLSLQLGTQPGHYCSLWAVSSSRGRMEKRIATDFPAGIFHASSFCVASAPFQKHMYSHTGHRETRNLKGVCLFLMSESFLFSSRVLKLYIYCSVSSIINVCCQMVGVNTRVLL